MFGFKKQTFRTLVATDLASRGLDVRSIRTVINFDPARSTDAHVHRIGRTGRGGDQGVAHTLLLPTQTSAALQLLTHLRRCGQFVPENLLALARRDPRFRGDPGSSSSRLASASSSSSSASTSSHRSSVRENRGGGLGFEEEQHSSSQVRGHRAVGSHHYQQSECVFRQQFVRGDD
jgi:ATP-dependent RNA helicase DDX42